MTRRLLALLVAFPASLVAQGWRISGVSSAQFVELRSLVVDTAGVERSGALISAAPLLNDLTLAAWGLTEGLSLHANVRVRSQLLSGELVYPRANAHFDALELFAQLDRNWGRARVGRQWITGGLGAYDFDGANLLIRRNRWTADGWGGRALAAGLFEPHTSRDLAAVESRPPSQDGYVFGARVRYRPDVLTAASLMYQRVVQADLHGMFSERAAFDASVRRRGVVVDAAFSYDFASGDFNEARLRLGTAGARAVGFSAELRHAQPFFELWTIWGAFAPVGYDEARGSLRWQPRRGSLSLVLRGGYRRYGETHAGLDLRTNGWRVGADASWLGDGTLSAIASYDVDVGFGASRSDARARLRWDRSSGVSWGLEGSALQNIYEFRVGTGRVFGVVLDGAVQIAPDVRLVFDGGFYRHLLSNGALGPDWTQRRASTRLEWALGRDAGSAVPRKVP